MTVALTAVFGEVTAPTWFAADTDIRTLVSQGEHMDRPVMFGSDVWDIGGCPDVLDHAPYVRFNRLPEDFRPLIKQHGMLLTTPSLTEKMNPSSGKQRNGQPASGGVGAAWPTA